MLDHIFLRFKRTPLPGLGILLFSAVLCAVLCALHASNQAELAHYQEVFHTLPVRLTVTNLKGTKSDDLSIPALFAESFLGAQDSREDLADFVTDVQRKASLSLQQMNGLTDYTMVGASSRGMCRELWAENGATISWREGFDETMFASDRLVCLIPSDLDIQEDSILIGLYGDESFQLTIAGTVTGGEKKTIYVPFPAFDSMLSQINMSYTLDAMGATLRDNSRLEEFRGVMGRWYIAPDPNSPKVKWPGGWFPYYQYALDINDAQLRAASETLESSLTVNRLSTMLVFILSAGAGFLVGFLMIRQRKREITLMRTLGEANGRVYCSFALEQMLCVILGAALGGGYFMWQPAARLGLFITVYFVGLTAALLIFLHNNLLSTMKEDE